MNEKNLESIEEYFQDGHYKFDFFAKDSINFLRYIDMENVDRKDEFESEYGGMVYKIERDSMYLSLNALIVTGITEKDVSVNEIKDSLSTLAAKNAFKFNVVALDEIYITVYYHKVNTVKTSWYNQMKNAISYYENRKYATLSKMNLDLFRVIDEVKKLEEK